MILTCTTSYSQSKLFLMNKRTSVLSGSNQFLFSLYMSPAVEKRCSDGTEVGVVIDIEVPIH